MAWSERIESIKSGARKAANLPVSGVKTFFKWIEKEGPYVNERDIYKPYIERAEQYLREFQQCFSASISLSNNPFNNEDVKNAVRGLRDVPDQQKRSLIEKIEGRNQPLTIQESACLVRAVLSPPLLDSAAGQFVLTDILQRSQNRREDAFRILVGLSVSACNERGLTYAQGNVTPLIQRDVVIDTILRIGEGFAQQLATTAGDPTLRSKLPREKALSEVINELTFDTSALDATFGSLILTLSSGTNEHVESAINDIHNMLRTLPDEKWAFVERRIRSLRQSSQAVPASVLQISLDRYYEESITNLKNIIINSFNEGKRNALRNLLQGDLLGRYALEFSLSYNDWRRQLEESLNEVERLGVIERQKRRLQRFDKGLYALWHVAYAPFWLLRKAPSALIIAAVGAHLMWGSPTAWYVPNFLRPSQEKRLAQLEAKEASGEKLSDNEKKEKDELFKRVYVKPQLDTTKSLLKAEIEQLVKNGIVSSDDGTFLETHVEVFAWLKNLGAWSYIQNNSSIMKAVMEAVKNNANPDFLAYIENQLESKVKEEVKEAKKKEKKAEAIGEITKNLEETITKIVRDALDNEVILPTNIYSNENANYLNSHIAVWKWLNRLFRKWNVSKEQAAVFDYAINEMVTIVREATTKDSKLLDAIEKMSLDLAKPLPEKKEVVVEAKQDGNKKLDDLIKALERKLTTIIMSSAAKMSVTTTPQPNGEEKKAESMQKLRQDK